MMDQPRLKGRMLSARAALLGLSLVLSASTGPARADKVGVAAAVNPDAFSSLAGAPQSQLNIGKSIFFNERINTTQSGLVQVLLVDGSTFTVGPDSDLVIDKFVYDPNRGTGQIAASFSKGVMRFVGGKISKADDAVTIKTPEGTMGVRGCILLTQVTPPRVTPSGVTPSSFAAVLVYGKYLKMNQFVVYEPGNGIFIAGNGKPEIKPANGAIIAGLLAGLSKTQGNNSEASGKTTKPGTTFQLVNTVSANDLINDANTTKIVDQAQNQQNNTQPPQQITVRVLTAPGSYTAYGTTIDNPAEHGILGGDPNAQVDDFIWTFNIVNGRIVGTVSGLTESHFDCVPDGGCTLQTKVISPADVNFPLYAPNQSTGPCLNGICTITDATVTQNQIPRTFAGTAVFKPDFYAYQLVGAAQNPNQSQDPIVVLGGKGFSFGAPSGQLRLFTLTADVTQFGATGPFASAESSPLPNPLGPSPTVTPLMLLENDSNPASRSVWLQSSFTITGSGPGQESFVNVALGQWDPAGGLTGARRGGSQVDINNQGCQPECQTVPSREAFSFSGDIASLAAPDGSHFLGSQNPNIVVGFDTAPSGTPSNPNPSGNPNIGRDAPLDPNSKPLTEQVGSTYHIGVGGAPIANTQSLQGSMQGYAAGMVESKVPTGSLFTNAVASTSANDLSLSFDSVSNTLHASITVRDVQNHDSATDAYILGFGDDPQNPQGRSAYVNDQNFAAIESANPLETAVVQNNLETAVVQNNLESAVVHQNNLENIVLYQNASANSYFVSGAQLGVTKYFPDTFGTPDASANPPPFCTNCEFLKWGAWGTRIGFGNGEAGATQYVDNIHLGWWVAADLASTADLDTLASLGATATYNGHAIGNVANNLSGQGWKTYVATGDLAMTWGFRDRSGPLTISRFDTSVTPEGLTFQGQMSAPGVANGNHFGGPLSGQLPNPTDSPGNYSLSGSAVGSFANNGPGKPAAGVVGNWNVGNQAYKAGGIFAGSGTPVPSH